MSARTAAETCFVNSEGDRDAAVDALLALAADDAELATAILRHGAVELIASVDRDGRSARFSPAAIVARSQGRVANADDTAGLRAVANWTIMESWSLWGGKRLGDATAPDLQVSIAKHEAQSAGHQRIARFERSVMLALTRMKKKTVRDAFKPAQLESLLKQAEATDAAA